MQTKFSRIAVLIGVLFLVLIFFSKETKSDTQVDCSMEFRLSGYSGDPSGCTVYVYLSNGSGPIASGNVNSNGRVTISGIPSGAGLIAHCCCGGEYYSSSIFEGCDPGIDFVEVSNTHAECP